MAKVESKPIFDFSILPWQTEQWEQLHQAQVTNHLAHALLFIGSDGIGKTHFALAFAAALLCRGQLNAKACEQCESCLLLKGGSHPDLLQIMPDEPGKKIGVDKIRSAIQKINETSLMGGYRVVVIHPATAMNTNAANALLKTLEEPAPNTIIILLSNQSQRLPATIMSRCQKLYFASPQITDALQWLQMQIPDQQLDKTVLRLTHNAPLTALRWLQEGTLATRTEFIKDFIGLSQANGDPLKLASKWHNSEALLLNDSLISWLSDMIRFQLTTRTDNIINTDLQLELSTLSAKVSMPELFSYYDQLLQARIELMSSMNLNKQMLLENLFIRWTQYVTS